MSGNKRLTLKALRRPVYQKLGAWRQQAFDASPPWAQEKLWPLLDYLDMFFVDHGIFRLFYANRHKMGERAWRSAQPWPHQVRYYAKSKGIKTIVNLRGERDCGSYRLEQAACKKYGIEFVNYKMHSGAPPLPEVVTGFKEFFENLEHPILIHCKSGADRAGIAATLYQHLLDDKPMNEAVDQMSIRFGHFKHARTGVLDHFLERYLAANEEQPISLSDWVKTQYDQDEIRKSFKTNFWSRVLVEKILRRE